jgi:hypothetical protein
MKYVCSYCQKTLAREDNMLRHIKFRCSAATLAQSQSSESAQSTGRTGGTGGRGGTRGTGGTGTEESTPVKSDSPPYLHSPPLLPSGERVTMWKRSDVKKRLEQEKLSIKKRMMEIRTELKPSKKRLSLLLDVRISAMNWRQKRKDFLGKEEELVRSGAEQLLICRFCRYYLASSTDSVVVFISILTVMSGIQAQIKSSLVKPSQLLSILV